MRNKKLVRMAAVSGVLALVGAVASPVMASSQQAEDGSVVFIVSTNADATDSAVGDGLCSDDHGRCTLRAAVQEANASGGPTTIRLNRSAKLTITNAGGDEEAAASGDLDVIGDIRIVGTGRAAINANGIDRALEVMSGATLQISGVNISNGMVDGGENPIAGSGGAIANDGVLTLDNVAVVNNTAAGPLASGGGILNTADLTVRDSTFTGNSATRAGGAIEANAGSTTITGSMFSLNHAGPTPGNGGALHLTGAGTVDVTNSVVTRNTATAEGGGLWNSGSGVMRVSSTSFTKNVAEGDAATNGGGALFNDGGELHVAGSHLGYNWATGMAGSGGGILNDNGTLFVTDTTITRNRSKRAGGGIETVNGMAELTGLDLTHNDAGAAPGNGGGLHVSGSGDVEISESTVSHNSAASEGGGLWNSAGTMTITEVYVGNNNAKGDSADNGGGGLFNNGGTMIVEQSTIKANRATGDAGSGGGIFNNDGVLEVEDSTISNNNSNRAGGGIEALNGMTTLRGVTLKSNRTNRAPGNGGGLHLTAAGSVDILGSSITRNRAGEEGGGLWNSASGTMTVTDSVANRNAAPVGPNLFNDGGTFVFNGAPVPSGDN